MSRINPEYEIDDCEEWKSVFFDINCPEHNDNDNENENEYKIKKYSSELSPGELVSKIKKTFLENENIDYTFEFEKDISFDCVFYTINEMCVFLKISVYNCNKNNDNNNRSILMIDSTKYCDRYLFFKCVNEFAEKLGLSLCINQNNENPPFLKSKEKANHIMNIIKSKENIGSIYIPYDKPKPIVINVRSYIQQKLSDALYTYEYESYRIDVLSDLAAWTKSDSKESIEAIEELKKVSSLAILQLCLTDSSFDIFRITIVILYNLFRKVKEKDDIFRYFIEMNGGIVLISRSYQSTSCYTKCLCIKTLLLLYEKIEDLYKEECIKDIKRNSYFFVLVNHIFSHQDSRIKKYSEKVKKIFNLL